MNERLRPRAFRVATKKGGLEMNDTKQYRSKKCIASVEAFCFARIPLNSRCADAFARAQSEPPGGGGTPHYPRPRQFRPIFPQKKLRNKQWYHEPSNQWPTLNRMKTYITCSTECRPFEWPLHPTSGSPGDSHHPSRRGSAVGRIP